VAASVGACMMPPAMDDKQVTALLAETIAELPDGVPAGHLYAAVCSHVSLTQFERVVDSLESSGAVKRSRRHVLRST